MSLLHRLSCLRFLLPTLVLLCATSVQARAAEAAATPAAGKVTILIWEEFLSPKVIKTLKNRHALDVRLITFTTPDERDDLLAKHARSIDLVVADSSSLGSYMERGILQPIDARRIPNLKRVLTRWQEGMNFSVPYLWGHTGIAWRTDKVKQPLTGYRDLLALAKLQPGKVSLLDDPHEALMALKFAAGKPPYEITSAGDVQAAAKLLPPWRGKLRFVGAELTEKSPLVTGEIIAAQAYNGDIAFLRDHFKAPLAFAVPSTGCMIWQESFLLLKSAPGKDAAYKFLNLINEATLSARNASEVRYATSNALAIPYLEPAFRDDPIIRPTLDGLENCYFYPVFDAATQGALDAVRLTP
ncbi:MAG: ABC transporter substrate-binding protein [Pseudomonadota bacterium]